MDEKLNEDTSSNLETPRPLPPLLKYAGIIILAAGIFLILQSFMIAINSNSSCPSMFFNQRAEQGGSKKRGQSSNIKSPFIIHS